MNIEQDTIDYLESVRQTLSRNMHERTGWMLRGFCAFVNLRDVTPDLVDDFSDWQLEKGHKHEYVRMHRNVIRTLFDWKIRKKTWKVENPVQFYRIKPPIPSKRRPVTEPEFRLLLSLENREWFKHLISVAWHTGLRLGDAALLKWESVDLLTDQLNLLTGKKNKPVQIPFGRELHDLLASLVGTDPKWVIPEASVHYRYDRHKTLSNMFCVLVRRAKISDCCFHCFRHAFVSRHLAGGANPAVLATITGHSLNSIMTYVSTSIDTKRQALGLAALQ